MTEVVDNSKVKVPLKRGEFGGFRPKIWAGGLAKHMFEYMSIMRPNNDLTVDDGL